MFSFLSWATHQVLLQRDGFELMIWRNARHQLIWWTVADKDFWLGLPREQFHQVARLVVPSTLEFIKFMFSSYTYLWFHLYMMMSGSEMNVASSYPPWLNLMSVRPLLMPVLLKQTFKRSNVPSLHFQRDIVIHKWPNAAISHCKASDRFWFPKFLENVVVTTDSMHKVLL